MRMAVAGGTGWTGRLVVEALRAGGDDAVVLARSAGVDLLSGEGLAERLVGVDAVIDVTNVKTQSAKRATRFFETVAGVLLEAEERAGVRHHVALSIIGIDRVDLGYYRGKRRQEELVLGGAVPSTVLRATQFHEFAAQMLEARGPVTLAPKMLCQPVAVAEVAAHLAGLARGQALGRAPELAGPEEHLMMSSMVKRLAAVRRERRPVLAVGMPGRTGRRLVEGALLPTEPGPRGTVTFDAWLAGQAR